MYQKTVLDQGLRVMTSTMPQTRSVSVGFFIGVGSRYESKQENGITHFIEHMLFKGTEKRPSARDIAVAIEGIGGVFNASTGRELTTYWAKVGQDHFRVALDVLADMLLHSKLEATELEKERGVIIEEINMNLDSPSDWVHVLATELLWPDHPLGRDQAGTKATVSEITRKMVQDYLHRHYQPANAVLAVAGNIEHEEAVSQAATQLGAWMQTSEHSYAPMGVEQDKARVRLEHRPTQQAHLALLLPGISRFDDDKYDLSLLNTVLGQGMSSRLFLEVREKRGLAYSVYSYVSPYLDAGLVGIYAGVDADRIDAALGAILEQLDRMRQEPISEGELHNAKEFTKGRLQLQMEDSFAVASWVGRQETLEERVLTVDEVLKKIDEVTDDKIQQVAQRLFQQDKLNLAVVGPYEHGHEEHFQSALSLS